MEFNELKFSDLKLTNTFHIEVKQIPNFQTKFEEFSKAAWEWESQGQKILIVAPTKGHLRRVNELLIDKELDLEVQQGHISSGFRLPEANLIVVAEHEIFGRTHKHRHRRKSQSQAFQRGFKDLKEGDLLVHVDYGIGKFNGSKEIKTGIGGGEFLEILYAEDQKLYIPMDGLGLIQKYLGSGESNPPLNRLGGSQWKKQKKKVKESILEMANDLLKIYASREVAQGHAYPGDPVMMQGFSDSFEYVETDDQLKAIEDVLDDLSKDKPMDRLICGDVGYGKTEVAMRAAYQTVLDKKQVAVLVPTTILAQQHLNTFRERFQLHPVSIDMVSRFRNSSEQKQTLEKLKQGKLDIVIGTHSLLSKDVKFLDLGLLIIDEEQRFGVRHKEQLKKMRASVDILTLTATPIPRTLHFSLMGVRDLSVIETPPSDRLSIKTYIRKFEEGIIRKAVLREIERGGQVYFVHNRVQGIHSMAALLQKIIPEVKIGIAHGQMQERMLETVMKQFIDGEIDLLLCTSIIESGLDIPTANTIIINRADKFGLAQLYQLRGRVGRYRHQAFAYLLVPGTMSISEEARKRLFAIEEMSDLGAGFQLAARDMEIRGTGNMLGKNQSGHISAIGFDLYCKMMEETINEIQGQAVDKKIDTLVDIQIKGYIPTDYIQDMNQRLEMYRRLQLSNDIEDIESLKNEIKDRFGPIPEPLEKLIAIIELRMDCQRLHVTELILTKNVVIMKIAASTPISSNILMDILEKKMKLVSEFEINLLLEQSGWRENVNLIKKYLKKILNAIDVA